MMFINLGWAEVWNIEIVFFCQKMVKNSDSGGYENILWLQGSTSALKNLKNIHPILIELNSWSYEHIWMLKSCFCCILNRAEVYIGFWNSSKNHQILDFTFRLQPIFSPHCISSARRQRIRKLQPICYTVSTSTFIISWIVIDIQPET